jgi:hypothetical protein
VEYISDPVRFRWERGLLVAETRVEGEVVGRYVMRRAIARITFANLHDALSAEPVRVSGVVLPFAPPHR